MLRTRAEMTKKVREGMHGGSGSASLLRMTQSGEVPHCRLLAEVELEPGASIGEHPHNAETECYIINEGHGTVYDNGVAKEVGPGDIVITGGGQKHSIINTGDTLMRFLAIVVTLSE